jgi:rRNA maturation endonuclease Nob1
MSKTCLPCDSQVVEPTENDTCPLCGEATWGIAVEKTPPNKKVRTNAK